MLVLRLFYTPAPRNVTFVPEQGVWVSGTDTFSSSSSNTYTTGQTINVPQNTHLTRPGYELIGWTTNHDLVDTTITDAWINDPNRSLESLKTLLGDSFASVFFDLNYTVTADSDQFLYAMWAPAETTFLVGALSCGCRGRSRRQHREGPQDRGCTGGHHHAAGQVGKRHHGRYDQQDHGSALQPLPEHEGLFVLRRHSASCGTASSTTRFPPSLRWLRMAPRSSSCITFLNTFLTPLNSGRFPVKVWHRVLPIPMAML